MQIGKLRLYLETTVFNYYFDEDRPGHQDVVKLFEAIGAGQFDGYASTFVMAELRQASEPKRSNMLNLADKYGIIVLRPTPDVVRLSGLYIKKHIIPSSYRYDSAHIAMAAVNKLDIVVSYNFKHINRDKTKALTSAINLSENFGSVAIYTAKEVLSNE